MLHNSFLSKVKVASAVIVLFLAGCGKDEDAKVALKSIKISPETEVTLAIEGTQKFTATPEPADATDVNITWDVSNTQVISVADDGLVTAKAVGEATVWAYDGNVQSRKVTVKVTLKALTSFTVAPTELRTLTLGDEPVQLVVTKTPADAGGSFTYVPGDDAVVTVNADGLVTIVGEGSTNITVTSGSLVPVVVPVTVSLPALTSFSVTPNPINLEVGDAPVQLVVTKTPSNAGGAFTYVPENDAVVTVSAAGLVTIAGEGSTNITVTSGNLPPVVVPVTVTPASTTPDALFNKEQWTVTAPSVWGPAYGGEKMLDGDLFTFWHTSTDLTWPAGASFTVDMKGNKLIEGFYLNHRNDGPAANPKTITIETSRDENTWTQVYQTDNLSQVKTEAILLDLEEASIARYFRVTITASANGDGYTFIAEIGAYNTAEPYVPPVVEEGNIYALSPNPSSANNITLTPGADFVTIVTTGPDPNIQTNAIGRVLGGNTATLHFKYKSNALVTIAEFFWCVAGGPEGGKSTGATITIPQADDWTVFEYDLATAKSSFGFGASASHFIRFDPTSDAGYEISIKDLWIETDETP